VSNRYPPALRTKNVRAYKATDRNDAASSSGLGEPRPRRETIHIFIASQNGGLCRGSLEVPQRRTCGRRNPRQQRSLPSRSRAQSHRDEPVHYPVSCSPQAWASGGPIVILTALLGLKPDASGGKLRIVNPRLPEFLTFLEVRELRVGKSRLDLDFLRQGDRTSCRVVGRSGEDLAVNITHPRDFKGLR
jgi:hypothetical protein